MTTAFNNGRRHADNVAKDVASLARGRIPRGISQRDHNQPGPI